jgi:hypothetical protein
MEPTKETIYFYKIIDAIQLGKITETQLSTILFNDTASNVYKDLSRYLISRNISIDNFNMDMLGQILKDLSYEKYQTDVISMLLLYNIFTDKIPKISGNDEKQIKLIINKIQKPYLKFCQDEEINYNYFMRKIFELLELYEYLDYFPLPPANTTVVHDKVWKGICQYLNWEFRLSKNICKCMCPTYIYYIFTRLFSRSEKIFALQKRSKIYVFVCECIQIHIFFRTENNINFYTPNKKKYHSKNIK